ncbi:DUF4280 domain-containing protein [Pseudoalteromonas sp. APC 3224]|uniref:DUF4280 domain-containing protein n=1 Tax=Pseudoalteromonas sp. APC 3224 TaxID=3035203 RepID=UPI0025B465C3|nr:DUF4280 domain-containing protein [Pseudoalteromonas sp. APC 3224]MDN3484445.1 DUF4280 domain-containing protein [Pseudoalteromonas sp. APC 3224]
MSLVVTMGAALQCNFGVAPSSLIVTPENKVVQTMPVATIMDHIPFKNILPFGMCTSLANPTVASATAAALGVLTPMPCIPMTTTPWLPGSVTVLTGNKPTLNNSCKLICNWGGCINVVSPGQIPVVVK